MPDAQLRAIVNPTNDEAIDLYEAFKHYDPKLPGNGRQDAFQHMATLIMVKRAVIAGFYSDS